MCFLIAIRFIWPFQKGHGRFKTAKRQETLGKALQKVNIYMTEENVRLMQWCYQVKRKDRFYIAFRGFIYKHNCLFEILHFTRVTVGNSKIHRINTALMYIYTNYVKGCLC